jgi:hypothetical protein
VFSEECVIAIYWGNVTAEPEFANKTVIKIVMLMGEFVTGIIGVMTRFLRKFFS